MHRHHARARQFCGSYLRAHLGGPQKLAYASPQFIHNFVFSVLDGRPVNLRTTGQMNAQSPSLFHPMHQLSRGKQSLGGDTSKI